MKDEMREGLGHCTYVRDVMSHDGVGDREGGGRTIGKVAHNETVCMWGSNNC